MSLLDDVSIVITPNAYNVGELYAVIPVPSYGSNQVIDGEFPVGTTAWTEVGTVSYSGGEAILTGDGTKPTQLIQSITGFSIGSSYRIKFNYNNVSSDSIRVNMDGTLRMVASSISSGEYDATFTATATSQALRFYAYTDVGEVAKLSNVIVEEVLVASADMDVTRATAATRVDENGLVNYAEVIGGEEVACGDFSCAVPLDYWTLASGWSIGGGKLSSSSTSTWGPYYAVGAATVGKAYKVKFSIVDYTSGTVAIRCGGAQSSGFSALGDYEVILVASVASNAFAQFKSSSSFTGSITNVSVKEVTRDNVPRIDYTGGGCPHILAEPQRTNLVTHSSDFNDSSWNADASNLNLTRTPNASTSPSGENDATKLIGNNTSKNPSTAYIQDYTGAAQPYISSIFAKKGEYDYLISTVGAYASGYWASFNLDNGTVNSQPTQVDTTANIEDYGNGWYRCTIHTTSTGGLGICLASPSVDGTIFTQYTNTTNGIYIWGGQLEVGSYVTSYIPTSGSTVTRNQDIFTRDGIGSLIGQTEGTFFIELSKPVLNPDTYFLISLNNAASNSDDNSVAIGFDNGDDDFYIRLKANSSTIYVSQNIASLTNTFYKIAVAYKSGASLIYIDGIPITPNIGSLSGAFSFSETLDNLSFDYNGNNGLPFYGNVRQLQVYKTALTDEQLILLTGLPNSTYSSYLAMANALNYTIQ